VSKLNLNEGEFLRKDLLERWKVTQSMMIRLIKFFNLSPIRVINGIFEIYSEEQINIVLDYLNNAKKIPQLAEEYNTSPYEIRRFLKDNNLYIDVIGQKHGYVLTEEQIIKLKEWLKKPLTEKLIDAKIKNYGSLENYNEQMISNIRKTLKEKYEHIYGENWLHDLYSERVLESIYSRFGDIDGYKQYMSDKLKDVWDNYTEEEKQLKLELQCEGRIKKYGKKYYNNVEKGKQTKLERYGDENYNNSKKATETTLKRYGTKNISYKYFYDNIWFDSSWEVQYYEYLKKNNIEFEYHPCRIEMKNGRFYEPDFLLIKENQLVEIKNPHMLNDKGELYDFANIGENELYDCKQKCMYENNVLIINDIEPYRQFTDWEMRKLRDESKVLLKEKKKKQT
jgi:hypothetical protein